MAIQREEKRQIKKEHYDSLDIDKMRVVFFGRRNSFQIRERCGRLHDNLIGDISLELLVRKANTVLYADLVTDTTFLTQNSDALDFNALFNNTG